MTHHTYTREHLGPTPRITGRAGPECGRERRTEITSMNSSRISDVNNVRLSEVHLKELATSGISRETAVAAGVHTELDPDRVGELLNWSGPAPALGACLVFPYLDAKIQPMGYHRLKPSTPRSSKKNEDKGKAIKYEAPRRQPNRLYIPPDTRGSLADPTVTILVTEGEKKALSADAAGFPCLSVPGVWTWQKKREKQADGTAADPRVMIDDLAAVAWARRRTFVVFDSDSSSKTSVKAAERALAFALTSAGADVVVIRLPACSNGEKQGLDDYLVRNGPNALRELLTASANQTTDSHAQRGDEAKDDAKKPTAADQLVQIAQGETELWHDQTQTGFASVGRRSMPVRSKLFRQWLTRRFRAMNSGRVPHSESLTNAANAIEAAAVFDGPLAEAHVRVAQWEGRVYLHLGDDADTVYEVDATDWRECPNPPVRFRRVTGALALPRPERGGSLDALRQLLNLDDGDQFVLIVAYLCIAMFPGGPQPLLVANGEQGSGKTTVVRAIKALLDPGAAPVRCEPKDARDLMIAARNNHVLAMDNLSHLPGWLSDALCRLSTGGGFATRELYTNDDETIFDAKRPVILAGIEEFVTRGDLLERAILLRLPAIPDNRRMTESSFWTSFYAVRPKLLGALLDRVAGGLRELPGVRLEQLPRMADFARWGVACERAAGERSRFMEAYTANQGSAHEQAIDGSSLAAAVVAVMAHQDFWEGTATELYKTLAPYAPVPATKDWPKAPNILTGRLRRLAPNLRRIHRIDFDTDRANDSSRRRCVRLRRLPDEAGDGSSEPAGAPFNPDSSVNTPDDSVDAPGRTAAAGSSIAIRPELRGSDGPDDPDGLAPSAGEVTTSEYDRFLAEH